MTHIPAALALIAALSPAGLHAADSCIKLDVELLRYDAYGAFIEKGRSGELNFEYEDRFQIQVAGNLPGVFRTVSISPANVSNFDFHSVESNGLDAVVLPCGGDDKCLKERPFYVFNDDGGTTATEQEVVVIYYFPCRSETPAGNRVVKPILAALSNCAAVIPQMREGAFQIARYESIVQDKALTRVCTPERDAEGRIVLDQRLDFTVSRKN